MRRLNDLFMVTQFIKREFEKKKKLLASESALLFKMAYCISR